MVVSRYDGRTYTILMDDASFVLHRSIYIPATEHGHDFGAVCRAHSG